MVGGRLPRFIRWSVERGRMGPSNVLSSGKNLGVWSVHGLGTMVGFIPRIGFNLGLGTHIRDWGAKTKEMRYVVGIRADTFNEACYLAEAYPFPIVETVETRDARVNRDGRVASASAKLAFLAGSTFDFILWHLPDGGSNSNSSFPTT